MQRPEFSPTHQDSGQFLKNILYFYMEENVLGQTRTAPFPFPEIRPDNICDVALGLRDDRVLLPRHGDCQQSCGCQSGECVT